MKTFEKKIITLKDIYKTEFEWQLQNKKIKSKARKYSGRTLNKMVSRKSNENYQIFFNENFIYFHKNDVEENENKPSVFDGFSI